MEDLEDDVTTSPLRLPKISTRIQSVIKQPEQPDASSKKETEFKLPPLPGIKKTKKSQEGLKDYITKKRELQMIKFNLEIEETEVNDLACFIAKEEKDLSQAETALKVETKAFEEFRQESTRLATEASEKAEIAVKLKMEKMQEIKRLREQIEHIKEDMAKYEDSLRESQTYEQFFAKLIPKREGVFDPKDLFDVYDGIRSEIFVLIEEGHYREEKADSLRKFQKQTNERIAKSIKVHEDEVAKYNEQLATAEKNKKDIDEMLKRFHEHVASAEYQKRLKEITLLNEKIAEIYESNLGRNEETIGPLSQFAALEELFDTFTTKLNELPKEKVIALRKLRKQQRIEIQRRSRLLAAKSDAACSRCEERNKQKKDTNPKSKNKDLTR